MSLFIGISIWAICTLMFFYDGYRLSKILNIKVCKYILLGISLLFSILSFFSIWYTGDNTFLTVLGTISSWIFVLSFLLLIFFGIEHIISIWYKVNKWVILGVLIVLLGLGFFFAFHTKVTNLDIESNKIDKDLKILLVSDIHVDYVLNQYHLKTIGKLIKKEQPDIVLIAGDLLNRPHKGYVEAYTYFQKNDYDVPIIAIMGNHDVIGDTDVYQKISDVSPIDFLDNQSIEIDGIQIVGIIDKSIRGDDGLYSSLDEAAMNMTGDMFTILMTHQPIDLDKLKDYPVDLEVAGHTHRGQIYGFRKVVELMNDYDYGKFEKDGKIAFVTQGIGTWGLPYRLGTQSEAVVINLKAK